MIKEVNTGARKRGNKCKNILIHIETRMSSAFRSTPLLAILF